MDLQNNQRSISNLRDDISGMSFAQMQRLNYNNYQGKNKPGEGDQARD